MVLAIRLLVPVATASAQSAQNQAKELFRQYVELEAAFDPRISDLFSDAALIENKRTYPTGEVKVPRISAHKYKALIRD